MFYKTHLAQEINMSNRRGRYTVFNFLFDVIMTAFTAGFWLIWVFVREVRG